MDGDILSTIGNTPLIRLKRYLRDAPIRLFAKLESFNPGGSAKDRPALGIIKHAIEAGEISPGATIVESSSGNMGIGLAQVCAYYGLRFICVVDPKASPQNLAILKAYGAELCPVLEPDPETGEFLQARIRRVQTLVDSVENGFWPNQYANRQNPQSHYRTTMHEIATALDGEIDYLFCAISTCGTIRGCVEYIRDHDLPTKVFAVDAIGSAIFGGSRGKRLIPGHGAGIQPQLSRAGLRALIHDCIRVSDLDCVVGCRRLMRLEAIFAGGSAGGVMVALQRVVDSIPAGSTCVVIFHDNGSRYVDTVYSDAWVTDHFGDVSHLWQEQPPGEIKSRVLLTNSAQSPRKRPVGQTVN
jgi:cysteine synthase A